MGMLERAKKPEVKLQRLKLLVYGDMGTGKSTIGASFKDCIFLDTEDVMSKPKYQRLMNAKEDNSKSIAIRNLDDILATVQELISRKHSYKTLVVDSLTVAYINTKQIAAKTTGVKYGADAKEANARIRQLCSLLLTLDMNIIVLCQAKKDYDTNMAVAGQTYDCYAGLGYMFDVVLETTKVGKVFSAVIHKSRLDGFETGEEIDFSYADVVRRCGADVIEREVATPMVAEAKPRPPVAPANAAPPQVATVPNNLISIEQVKEIETLVDLSSSQKQLASWLRTAKISTIHEMTQSFAERCISYLTKVLSEEAQ